MSYHGKFLKARGRNCIIHRKVPVNSKVSIKRSTKASRDLGIREGYWEGTILLDASLSSGELITIDNSMFLVQSANFDPSSSETAFFAAKTNTIMQHQRISEIAVGGNIYVSWVPVTVSVAAYVEIVTYALRQFDPGLLEQTKYVAQVPKSIGAVMLDRFAMSDGNYQVVSINNAGLEGVSILQLGTDTRP